MASDRRQAPSAPPLWRRQSAWLALAIMLIVSVMGLLWHSVEDMPGTGPMHYVPPQATLVVSLHPSRLLCDNILTGGPVALAEAARMGLGYLAGKPMPVAASFRGRIYLYRLPSEPGVWFVTYRGPGGTGPVSKMLRPLAVELLGPAQAASSRFYVMHTPTPGVHVAAFAPFWMRQTALARLSQVSKAPMAPAPGVVSSVAHGGHLTVYLPLTAEGLSELTRAEPSALAKHPASDDALKLPPGLADDESLEGMARRATLTARGGGGIVAHLQGRLLFFPGRVWGHGVIAPAQTAGAQVPALWPALAPGLDEPLDGRVWASPRSRGPAAGGLRWPATVSALRLLPAPPAGGRPPLRGAVLTDYLVAHPATPFRQGWLARQRLYRNGRALANLIGLEPDAWLSCLGPDLSLERIALPAPANDVPALRPIVSVGLGHRALPATPSAPDTGWQLSMPVRDIEGAVAGVARLRARRFIRGAYPSYQLELPAGELLCSDKRLTLTTMRRALPLEYRTSPRAGVIASLGPGALRSLLSPTGFGANPYVAHLCNHLNYLHVEGRPLNAGYRGGANRNAPAAGQGPQALEVRLRLEHSLDVFALGQLMASP